MSRSFSRKGLVFSLGVVGIAAGLALGLLVDVVMPSRIEQQRLAARKNLQRIYDSARAYYLDESNSRGSVVPIAKQFPGGRPLSLERVPYRREERHSWRSPHQTVMAKDDRFSTFALDVDTGSYTFVRREILEGADVDPAAVRVEEFLNYFKYDDPPPPAGRPFAVHMELAPSPYSRGRHLLRVALRSATPPRLVPAHFVFLVDVSGSMDEPDKLPLAKAALRLLLDGLREGDTVAIVTYAGATRVVLPPTSIARRDEILGAIDSLVASGSTAMGAGLELAYEQAGRALGERAISRVIVLSDGDANVGARTHDEMLELIAERVRAGVTLTTVGFGQGNYKDDTMEQLADRGNGVYYYIGDLHDARRAFVDGLASSIDVLAHDVKIQVEFNPAVVRSYRLIGYENREVADHDFRRERADGGELGPGHCVVAVYELSLAEADAGAAVVTRVRYKEQQGGAAQEVAYALARAARHASFAAASTDFRFSAAVVGAAEILRASPAATEWTLASARSIAAESLAGHEDRAEFVELLDRLSNRLVEAPPVEARPVGYLKIQRARSHPLAATHISEVYGALLVILAAATAIALAAGRRLRPC